MGGSAAEIGASEARAGVMSIEDFVEVVRAKHLYKSCMVIQESCGVDAPWRDGSLLGLAYWEQKPRDSNDRLASVLQHTGRPTKRADRTT